MAASNSDGLLAEAQKAYKAGDLSRMRDLLKQALAVDPKNSDAWLLATYATDNPTQQRQFIDRAKQLRRSDARILLREKELFPDIDNGISFTPTPPQTTQSSQPKAELPARPVSSQSVSLGKPLSPTDHIPTLADGVRLKGQGPLTNPVFILVPVVIVVLVIIVLALLPPTKVPSTSLQFSPVPQSTEAIDATRAVLLQTATMLGQTRNAMIAGPTLSATYLAPAKTQTALIAEQTQLSAVIGITQTQAILAVTQTAAFVDLNTGTPVAETQIASSATQAGASYKSTLKGKLVAAQNIKGRTQIVTLNADGSALISLNLVGVDPAWSPNGQQIVYTNREHQAWLHMVGADGAGDVELPIQDAPFGSFQAAWSPDGGKLIFAGGTRVFLHALMITNSKGLEGQQLIDDNQAGDWPSWSPNGKQIAYTKSDQIFVVNVDGTSAHAVAKQVGARSPVWSPDGKQIAFDAGDDNDRSLYIMSLDGSDLHRLTANTSYVSNPVWSPDGKHLAGLCYDRAIRGTRICVMDLDGANLTFITDGGFDGRVSWK